MTTTPNQLRQQRMDDMRDVLNTTQGQRVIWEIMSDAGLMSRIPAIEAGLTQRVLGKRDVAVSLYEWIMTAAPRTFLKMLGDNLDAIEGNKSDDDV